MTRLAADLVGEDPICKRVQLTKKIMKYLKNEAEDRYGGNFSRLLRTILKERYALDEKESKEKKKSYK